MKRLLVILSVAFLVATPCFSQIIVGADKLNFYGVWNETMTADTIITDVPWDLVRDLGFTHGNYHIKRQQLYGVAGYPPLPAPAEMPSGFQLNAYLFRDYSSFSCHGSGSDGSAVNLGIKGLVVEYHPEFDGHYTRTDRDGNPCVGSGIRVAGARKYPGDERIDGPLCWYVDGSETPAGGTVISTPREYAGEIGTSCNQMRHCSIRVQADVSGVLSNDIIFSHVVYYSSGLVRHRKDFRRDDLAGHGVDFFEVAFSGQLFSGIDNDIQIEWSGLGELYFDRVMYFNDCGWNILAGNLDNAIDSTITLAEATANAPSIGGFQIADEIVPVQYQTIGYVDDYIRTNTEYQTFYVTWPEWLHPEQPKYYRYMMERTTSPSFRVDLYPFGPSCPTDGNEFQDIIQYVPIDHYRKFQEVNRDNGYHLDMHAIIQSYSLDVGGTPRYRYPSAHEILLQVELALSYGSKAIWYFTFGGGVQSYGSQPDQTYDGIIDRNQNITDQAVFDEIEKINARLTGAFGILISGLDWRGAISRHQEGDTFEAFSLTEAGKVTDVIATNLHLLEDDPFDTTFVEIGHLGDAANDYLYVVNRRTASDAQSDRRIAVTFANENSITVEEAPTGDIRILPTNGTCTLWYSPAEAKLLRISGNVWSDARSIDDTVMVLPNAALVIDNAVALGSHAHFVIQDGATVTVTGNGSIDLANGTIVCEGTGTIVMQNPNGLTGSGNLVTPNFDIEGEFVIPSASAMLVTGGGRFNFISGSPRMLVVLGRLLFECDSCSVRLDSIDEVRVAQNGLLSVAGEITVGPLMHINVWEQATLALNGLGETDSCIFQMKAGAEINTESTLDANFATFEGVPNPPADNEEWEGILVSGPNARISMNHVLIKDVHCDPSTQGTGIHFFAASNSGNRIENTRIVRENQSDKLGDGIFLQPWQSAQSYVELHCVETLDDWWTGLTSVSSECNATGLTTMFNKRGVGAHLTGNVLYLYQSRLEANLIAGLYAEAGSGTNVTTFGSYGSAPDGFNSIFGNGYVQIHLIGTYLNGGLSNFNDNNDIGHSSSSVLRMIVDSGAQASVTRNYWLTPTPVPSMFLIISGSCTWVPYLTQSNRPDDMECFSLSKSGRHSVLPPMDLSTMMEYGLNGRMSDVYAFVNTRITAGITVPNRVRILKALLATEIGHAREYPDSMVTAFNRVGAFLRQNAAALTFAPAALVALRAELYTWFCMPDSADVEFQTLATSFPGSNEYRVSLSSKLINAFNKQDSIDIEDAITEMSTAGCDSSVLRMAHSERRAYYRCRRSGIIPKRSDLDVRSLDVPATIQLTASPNPARGEVTITCILPEPTHVQIKLYSIEGKEIRSLYSGERDAGGFTIHDTVQNLIPGTYLYRATSRYHSRSVRILVVR